MLRLALLLALFLASASAAPLPPNRLIVASDGGLDPAPRVAIRHCSKGQIASSLCPGARSTAFWRPGVAVSMTFEIRPSTPPPSERAAGKGTQAIRHEGGAGRPRRTEHREDLRHLLRTTGTHDLRELWTYAGLRPMFTKN